MVDLKDFPLVSTCLGWQYDEPCIRHPPFRHPPFSFQEKADDVILEPKVVFGECQVATNTGSFKSGQVLKDEE